MKVQIGLQVWGWAHEARKRSAVETGFTLWRRQLGKEEGPQAKGSLSSVEGPAGSKGPESRTSELTSEGRC